MLSDRSPGKALLDWNTRVNIAVGVAKGLEYLHDKGVVYRKPMSSSDILLRDGYHPKLSQYGLAELGQPVAEDEQLCINVTRTAASYCPRDNIYEEGDHGVERVQLWRRWS